MRRQAPVARCFVTLCFSAAVTLAAFEWRNPFPGPVVTPETTPDVHSDTLLIISSQRPMRSWLSRVFARSLDSPPVEASPVETSVQLVLSLESRLLEVRAANQPSVFYEVAVGQADWQTPQGEFRVINKLENPAWQHPITQEEIAPGPENPLGTRWIGFWSDGQAQIGFHGTNQEELIGEAVSHGCVRMRNRDIEALYQQVEVNTLVVVEP
ncbi:MAG: L,D-transpeptidase [Phormidesmis sp.]